MASIKIPIITCFDVEPDPRVTEIGYYKPWVGYQNTFRFLSYLRKKLIQATSSMVHYSWFFRLDDQIAELFGSTHWPLQNYKKMIDESTKYEDEFGIRPFTYKWNPIFDDWVAIYDDLDFCNHCIHVSFETYRKFFGKKCASYRMGNRWTSNATIDFAERLGLQFDLTLEPGRDSHSHDLLIGHFTGSLPDFTYVPQTPYLPSKTDFQIPDPKRNDGLWMVPLSADKIEGGMLSGIHRFRHIMSGRRIRHQYFTLDFGLNPWIFRSIANQLLKKNDPPFLAIATSVSVSTEQKLFDHMRTNFEFLMSHAWVKRFVFSTPQEALGFMNLRHNGYQKKIA